jgi:hypothetical protein
MLPHLRDRIPIHRNLKRPPTPRRSRRHVLSQIVKEHDPAPGHARLPLHMNINLIIRLPHSHQMTRKTKSEPIQHPIVRARRITHQPPVIHVRIRQARRPIAALPQLIQQWSRSRISPKQISIRKRTNLFRLQPQKWPRPRRKSIQIDLPHLALKDNLHQSPILRLIQLLDRSRHPRYLARVLPPIANSNQHASEVKAHELYVPPAHSGWPLLMS